MWTMITRDNCKYCEDAKFLLQEKSQQVTTYNVQTPSSKWLLTLLKKSGVTTVPQVFKPDGSLVGGYTELKELLTEGPL
jgi:glutaredoxin